MAILEEETTVIINSANIKYYERLGYNIPKYINEKGKTLYKQGEEIKVKVEDLTKGSHSLVTKVCDDCGKQESNKIYAGIVTSRNTGDGKDRCFKCARIQGELSKRLNISYEDSLEYYATSNNKEYLIIEFSPNNKKTPREIHPSSNDRFLWICMTCKSEYDAKLNNRTSGGCNCPYCTGQKVNNSNCLWTTHNDVARLLANHKIGYLVTAGTGKKAKFTCPDCGDVDEKSIKSIVRNGFSCSKCSDGFSFPEKVMIELLSQTKVDFKTQMIFKWSKNKRYDFYIPSLGIIETHGNQHYEDTNFIHLSGKSLNEEQENDQFKERLARENGVENYIVINCSKSDINFIKENILSSEFVNLIDLSNINWLKCHEYACTSLVKKTCELWNTTKMTVSEIGKVLNIDKTTARRYLKQGTDLAICTYNHDESMKRSSKLFGAYKKKKVIQLTKENEFIKEWDCIAEAARELDIQHTGIIMTCKGKISQSGGYKWAYATAE